MKTSYFSMGLRRTLKELKLTQEHFAEEVGITQSAIANLMTRGTRVKTSTLMKIYTGLCEHSQEHADFLLIEHLRDEIERIGVSSTRFDVSFHNSDDPALDSALKTLKQHAGCSQPTRDMLVQMANLFFSS